MNKKTKKPEKRQTITTTSERETWELAQKFAQSLTGGETLCLVGDLGSGKTAFAKGLATGLGVKAVVTSPTFVLLKIYRGKKYSFVHIDAYRLSSGRELAAIGVNDYLNNPNCVTVIEWADRVKDIWPRDCVQINFQTLTGDKRRITYDSKLTA